MKRLDRRRHDVCLRKWFDCKIKGQNWAINCAPSTHLSCLALCLCILNLSSPSELATSWQISSAIKAINFVKAWEKQQTNRHKMSQARHHKILSIATHWIFRSLAVYFLCIRRSLHWINDKRVLNGQRQTFENFSILRRKMARSNMNPINVMSNQKKFHFLYFSKCFLMFWFGLPGLG